MMPELNTIYNGDSLDVMRAAKDGQVIYVPTEAGLPILEANRLKK